MIFIDHFTCVTLKFVQYIYNKTNKYQVLVSLDVNTQLYPLFLIYSHAITYYSYIILQIFIVSVIMMCAIHMLADKWVHLV